jgi:hypothetical protein
MFLLLELKSCIVFLLVGVDLVVHAAGPFQRREECSVLEAALDTNVKYSLTLKLVKGFSGFMYD